MPSYTLGFIAGGCWCLLCMLVFQWRNWRSQHGKVLDDLKRYGYHQVSYDGIEVRVWFRRSYRGVLRYSTGLFSFEVVLEKLPREDAKGYQWLPFIENSQGGRQLISSSQFGKMLDAAIEATQESHDTSLSLDARRTGSPI